MYQKLFRFEHGRNPVCPFAVNWNPAVVVVEFAGSVTEDVFPIATSPVFPSSATKLTKLQVTLANCNAVALPSAPPCASTCILSNLLSTLDMSNLLCCPFPHIYYDIWLYHACRSSCRVCSCRGVVSRPASRVICIQAGCCRPAGIAIASNFDLST